MKHNPAKFHPDLIWNNGGLHFLKKSPNKKNNNKISSDMRSVPDLKMAPSHLFVLFLQKSYGAKGKVYMLS